MVKVKSKILVAVVNKPLNTEHVVNILFLMMNYLEGTEHW